MSIMSSKDNSDEGKAAVPSRQGSLGLSSIMFAQNEYMRRIRLYEENSQLANLILKREFCVPA
jgi:hypothetical protein